MKNIALTKIGELAKYYGGKVISTPLPAIDFDGSGFEATEEYDSTYFGWRFYGNPSKQAQLLDLWHELTKPGVTKPVLSIEAAKQLLGKKLRLSYTDVNQGEYIIVIREMKVEKSRQVGQDTNMRLIFQEVINGEIQEPICDWIYEWQGIFCRGSGAERLLIEEIYD